MEGDLGINIMSALNKFAIINKLSCDASNDSDSGMWLYPLATDMLRCVWCDYGMYVCCILWPLGSVAYLWKENGDSTCTIAIKTINKQYATKINSNVLDCEWQF